MHIPLTLLLKAIVSYVLMCSGILQGMKKNKLKYLNLAVGLMLREDVHTSVCLPNDAG